MGVCEVALNLSERSKQSNILLSDEITLLAGQINAATYRLLKLIAEDGIRSCAHWLNWKCGIALGAAREKVRVARCLEELPKINAAFSSGEISYSKVRAMTRVATNDNEDYLLMIAKSGTASHIEKLVGKYQTVKRQLKPTEEPKPITSEEESGELISYQDDDGMWVIHRKLKSNIVQKTSPQKRFQIDVVMPCYQWPNII